MAVPAYFVSGKKQQICENRGLKVKKITLIIALKRYFFLWRKTKYADRYDCGKAYENAAEFYHSRFPGKRVPAAVQYGRCGYCRQVCGNQGAGSSWRHRHHYVPYYWVSDGADHRIYRSYFSEVRGWENGRNAENSWKCGNPFCCDRGSYDCGEPAGNAQAACFYAYAGGHF